MLVSEIIEDLRTYPQDKKFTTAMDFYTDSDGNTLIWDWNAPRQTVEEVIHELEKLNLDAPLNMDIEDGFIFRDVVSIQDKYWAPEVTYLDFE